LLGNGTGTFRTGTTILTGGGNAVAAGDINGDGLTDVVVTSSSQITSLAEPGHHGSNGHPLMLPRPTQHAPGYL